MIINRSANLTTQKVSHANNLRENSNHIPSQSPMKVVKQITVIGIGIVLY